MIDVPYLKEFLDALRNSKTSIDDYVDRLNYYWTTVILIFCAMIAGVKQIFGRPIDCMMPAEYPSTWNDYVREYCYVSSTYFKNPDGLIDGEVANDVVVQGYYQWVPFILVFQAICMCLPYVAWIFFQRSRDIDMAHLVKNAEEIRFANQEEREKKVNEFVEYVKQRLQYQGSRSGISYVGFGAKSSLLYLCFKALFILILGLQLSFMNKCFGKNLDTFWGFTMFFKSLTDFHWQQEHEEDGVFPRVTYCNFTQPILGKKNPVRTVQCVLMVNMFNEKIFVFLWCWFAMMFIASIFNFFYTIARIFVPQVRLQATQVFLKSLFVDPNSSTGSTLCLDDTKVYNFANRTLGPDGIQMFYFIERHCGSYTASEITCALYDAFFNQESRQSPLRGIHIFNEKQGVSRC